MTRTFATCVLLSAGIAVTHAAPQAGHTPASATPASTTAATPGAPAATTPDQAAAAPQGYTYKPEGRRDPFVTLVRGGTASAATATARAAGLAGLLTGEVSLRGTLASQGGFVAMLLGADARTYIVHAGDKLADGTIRTIGADELIIVQHVKDPLSVQKEREVRKMLRQFDGTN